MVQSNNYYKCRAIGVTSEFGLINDRAFSVLIFDECPTRRMRVAQGLSRWFRGQRRSPDAPGSSKNASGLVGISPKRGTSGARRQTQLLQGGSKPVETAPWDTRNRPSGTSTEIQEVTWYEPLYRIFQRVKNINSLPHCHFALIMK